jgi:K+:H+ antiporter
VLEREPGPLAELPATVPETRLVGHVILVGYGRVGERIGAALAEQGVPFVVIEQNRELVERLREHGITAVSGNAADISVLPKAHVADARLLVLAIPDAFDVRKAIEIARPLRPDLEIVARAHSVEEAELLRRERAAHVLIGEHELALGMARHVLEQIGEPS